MCHYCASLRCVCPGLRSSEEKAALLELAKQTNTQPRDVEALAKELRTESELEESRDERKQEIGELLTVGLDELDLADFLPLGLAEPLKMWCNWMSIRPAVALSAVLAAVSSLHEVGTELVIHKAMNFKVPPTLFVATGLRIGTKEISNLQHFNQGTSIRIEGASLHSSTNTT